MDAKLIRTLCGKWALILTEMDGKNLPILWIWIQLRNTSSKKKGEAEAKTRKGRFEVKGVLSWKPKKGGSNFDQRLGMWLSYPLKSNKEEKLYILGHKQSILASYTHIILKMVLKKFV